MTATRLTPVELWVTWHTVPRPAPPPILQLRSPGRDQPDHDRLVAAAQTTLTRRGLLDTHACPKPALADALDVLARPTHTLDLRYAADPDRMTIGLGAIRGEHGAVVLTEHTAGPDGAAVPGPVELLTGDATQVVPTLLAALGPIRRGPGQPINIPADLLDAALAAHGPDRWAAADQLAAHGVPRQEATALARMTTDVRAGAQLGATTAGHRAPHVIGAHATPAGWYVQLRRPAGPAATLTAATLTAATLTAATLTAATLTVAPADAATLARHWRDLAARTADEPARRHRQADRAASNQAVGAVGSHGSR